MVDIKCLIRRDILAKLVELVLTLVMVGLISGRMTTTNAMKTEVVHATAFMCIAICVVVVTSSLLDCPVDERLLAVVTAAEAVLFLTSGALLMQGFNPTKFTWPATGVYCFPILSSFPSDGQVLGGGIVAFAIAVVHAVDVYFTYQILQSPIRPSVAAKRRSPGATTSTA